MKKLKINEIFFSLQGETSRMGLPTVFVRLSGCPLRCAWCDTSYAFSGGKLMTLAEVLAAVEKHPTRRVCVTGGEPLAQKNCLELLTLLCDRDFDVTLETSGALDVSGVDERVGKILDIKAPGSGEADRNLFGNLEFMGAQDEIKFVLCSDADYLWAKKIVEDGKLPSPVIFSPVADSLSPRDLADWILRDGLEVRMQLQLHKLLWGQEKGR